MSFADGMSALKLEMPERIPRTEYSASTHWDLVRKVTGINVTSSSSDTIKDNAGSEFIKVWNYDMFWHVSVNESIFSGMRSKMGHAVYAAGGTDFCPEKTTLFTDPKDALAFNPMETFGLRDKTIVMNSINLDYNRKLVLMPDLVNMTGIYVTCMSGLIDLLGWDMLLYSAGLDSNAFGELMNRYAAWIMQYIEALAECESPVIMIHDDIVWTEGAFLHPDWYRKFLFPNYKKLFAPLIDSDKIVLFTSDGNYTQFIDDLAECGVNGFIMEPLTDMKYIADKYGKTHIFVGNADTRILLTGTKDDIYNEVKRCVDIGKKCPGFFMAVGNHIPSNTPIDNALWYNECYESLSIR